MTYAVLDLETTSKQSYKRVANPFDDDNRIVLLGVKSARPNPYTLTIDRVDLDWLKTAKTMVGHNIKFDLLYLWDYPRLQEWIANGGKIFDTMVAQYILDGQKPEALSLDILAPKYGGTKKTGISKLIKAGRCPSELYIKYPKAMRKYLQGDLINTEIVLLKQLQLLNKNGQLNLAKALMDSVLATTEMEFNGLYVNREIHKDLKTKKIYEIADKLSALEREVSPYWTNKVRFNPGSNDHISLLFFGGEVKYKDKQDVIKDDGSPLLIKTGKNAGKVKTKLVDCVCKFQTNIDTKNVTSPVKKSGFYQVDDKVISKIAKKKGKFGTIAKLLLSYRAANKEMNTYYEGFEKCIQPDGFIHGSLNQCVTDTGRLASSKPNLQNMPRKGTSEFKKIFTSRFGDDGVLIEADFKQLEVVAAAFLSNDAVMRQEITNGADMHLLNAEWVYQKPKELVTDEERTLVKQQTFQLLYGATAYALSLSVGCTEEAAKAFIGGFYAKYRGIAAWHKQLEMEVYKSAKTVSNSVFREGMFRSITGRIYKFREVQKRNGTIEFNLPDIKNYPVQGFATGDVVVAQLGRLYRALLPHRDKVRLVNTVHDSVLLDCKKEFAEETCKILKSVLEYREWMKELWMIDFYLPLKVDISIGNSWYSLIKASDYFKLISHQITA